MSARFYLGEWYCDRHGHPLSYDGVCDECMNLSCQDYIDTLEETWWSDTQPEGGFPFGDEDVRDSH